MENLRNIFNKNATANNKSKSKLEATAKMATPPPNKKIDLTAQFIPSGKRIKIYIITPCARFLTFNVDTNKRIKDIKNEAIIQLKKVSTDIAPRYRLIRAELSGSELNENFTLEELGIESTDSFLLIPRRHLLMELVKLRDVCRSPTQEAIDKATEKVESNFINKPTCNIVEIFGQTNSYFDIRKVFISLAQKAALLIGTGPYAQRVIEVLKYRIQNKLHKRCDILKCFEDLGFNKETAEYALKMQNGNYQLTLDWLMRQQSEQLTFAGYLQGMQNAGSIISATKIVPTNTTVENIKSLLALLRIYSHFQMPPTEKTVKILTDMGFDQNEVIKVLKKTCNNVPAASEYLCGLRKDSLIELNEGNPTDSKILKKILALPQIQVHLTNPKVLFAFISIIENEHLLRLRGGDRETGFVISNILQKYYEEKQNLRLNQFNTNGFEM